MEEPVEYNAGKNEESRIKIIYFSGCNTKPDMLLDITKQEAIERMANAILRVRVENEAYCCNDFAEAALDALLCK